MFSSALLHLAFLIFFFSNSLLGWDRSNLAFLTPSALHLPIPSVTLNLDQAGGMTLDELEASLASPIVATPPALLRPGVGASARGAAARGRGLLQNRHSGSGSYVSNG